MKKIIVTTIISLIIVLIFVTIRTVNGTNNPAGYLLDPVLLVTPDIYAFDDTYIGQTSSNDFTFSNMGTDPVTITDITFTDPAFSIDYTSFNIPPGQSGDIPVHFTPLSSGYYEGTMQIWSNDPVNNPYEVQLSGNGIIELNMGWEWIETGFNYILMDIEFPEGQNQIGYSIGQSLTYNGVGIVIKTTDGGSTWEQLTPEGIPGLQGCSFLDLNTGFAVGWDGYMIKTTDGGSTWDTIVVQPNIWQMVDVEFWDYDHGIVTAWTDGTFVTDDGGLTWTAATGITTAPQMIEYADENTVFLVGGEDRINRSTDGGYTWSEVYSTGVPGNILLGVDFLNSDFGIATGDYGHVLTTTDGGDSWVLTEPFNDQLLHVAYIWDQDSIWICGTPELVYKTTDGGNNWSTAYNGNWQKAFYRITFTDNYTGFMCGGSGGIVLRKEGINAPVLSITPDTVTFEDTFVGETSSENVTFSNTGNEPLEITDITFSNPAFSIDYTAFTIEPGQSGDIPVHFTPPASGLLEGVMQIWSNDPVTDPYEVQLSGTGVIELIDGWEWIETGYDFILMDIEFPEGQNQVGYCVGESLTYNGDGIVIKTTDGGSTWMQMTPNGIPGLTGMSFINMNTGFAVGWDDYLIKTTDGGLTWDTLSYASGTWSFYYDVEFWDENNGVVLAGTEVYVTGDGGFTWTTPVELNALCNMIEYVDENTLVTVGNENIILRSADGGLNWTIVNPASGGAGPVLLGVHFLDNNYGMAAGDYGYIFTTWDGGNTWTPDQQVGDQLLHTPFIWDEDTAWVVGTPEMVYKSINGGTNWNSAYSGNYDKAFYRITFTDNYTGFICGGSGGIVLRKEGLPELPAINVNPESIDFEDTYVGESSTEIITVSNSGFAELEITDISSNNDVFVVDLSSFTLDPGDSQNINVTFTPDEEGSFDGMIQITSNDPDNNVTEIELSGTGMIAYPQITVNPMTITFDTTLVNETTTENLTISNTGIATLFVTDIVSSNPVFTVDMTSFDIDPGATQDVEVTFAPDEQMLFEATLQIESNDPNGMVDMMLAGFGDIETNISDLNSENAIRIYPNPVKDILHLENLKDHQIIIYDILGNSVLKTLGATGTEEINVSYLPSGIYLVKITDNQRTYIEKIKITK
ncbi:MAG: choice-of-anchor D domain-containing protein [Bacteroidetes bacterium]|nr:choice-of-anchor D domain-containing protein [Bacteroidota bacterium]